MTNADFGASLALALSAAEREAMHFNWATGANDVGRQPGLRAHSPRPRALSSRPSAARWAIDSALRRYALLDRADPPHTDRGLTSSFTVDVGGRFPCRAAAHEADSRVCRSVGIPPPHINGRLRTSISLLVISRDTIVKLGIYVRIISFRVLLTAGWR